MYREVHLPREAYQGIYRGVHLPREAYQGIYSRVHPLTYPGIRQGAPFTNPLKVTVLIILVIPVLTKSDGFDHPGLTTFINF